MAVTENKLIQRRDGCRRSLAVAASTRIYQGTGVFVNSGGYADDDTATGANVFAGIAVGEANNASGSNADINVEVYTEGDFLLTGSGFTIADIGKDAFLNDNYALVVADAAGSVRIGKVVGYASATQLWVAIETKQYVQQAGFTALTHTAPGTPDYAIQDLINSSAYGFVTKDEGNTVLKVLKACHDALKANGMLS